MANGMFDTFEAARQGVLGAISPAAQGMMQGQKEARVLQQAAMRAKEEKRRWDAEMKLKELDADLAQKKFELSEKRWGTESERVKAYAKSIDAQTKKWEADRAMGKGLPAPVKSLLWSENVLANPNATEAEKATANQIKINYSKGQKDIPSNNFMKFVDKQLANREFGNQKLKNDMEPAAYQELISEVSLMAHQMRSDNPKLKMKDAIEQAWTMTQPMLREQSWWEPGADIELVRGKQKTTPGHKPGDEWTENGIRYRINPETGVLESAK